MPKHMARHPLADLRDRRRLCNRPLHGGLVQAVPARRPPSRVATNARRREHELPPPLRWRVRILARQRIRQHHPAITSREVALVQAPDLVQLPHQCVYRYHRQRHRSILGPLAVPHHDLSPIEVDVLHPQVIYCRDRLSLPMDRLNPNGGSIAIGHPFGLSGSRLVGTIANEMQRRKARYGVVTMCVGGGQGAAALFERC